jgi:lipopolysaccharide export system protein LptA
MNKKTAIQLILLSIIIIILSVTFFTYFNNPQKKNSKLDKKKLSNNESKFEKKNEASNNIENLKYIATDKSGNQYLINAKEGTLNDEDNKLIKMKTVSAEVTFVNNSETIKIFSDSAIYNTVNFDTQFSQNIKVIYGQHKIDCEFADLIFSNNLAIFYDNVVYQNIDTKLYADKMEIDLITKDSKVYMNDINAKVKIIHKN